jgi:peptidoglycan/LPS O-acetylase OafA/YrhL
MNSLTNIRGLCVLLVIGAHLLPYLFTPKINFWNFGNTGVIGFFTLSSYLICSALFNNNFSYKRFIIRRIIRIYPLFIINFIVFIIIINFFKRNEIDYSEFYFFQMREWFLLIGNYRAINDLFFLHLWSVCVEMHFYLCLPLLALINKKLRNTVLIFLMIFSCGLNFYLVNNAFVKSVWILTSSHLGSFCIGALLANNERQFKKFAYSREMLIVLIPCLIFYTSTGSFFSSRWSGVNYLLIAVMFILILVVGLKNPSKKYRFLHYIGERSYSIYLTHFTVILIFMAEFKPDVPIQPGTATLQQIIICFIMILLIGSLEYYIFERQILKFKTKVSFIKI